MIIILLTYFINYWCIFYYNKLRFSSTYIKTYINFGNQDLYKFFNSVYCSYCNGLVFVLIDLIILLLNILKEFSLKRCHNYQSTCHLEIYWKSFWCIMFMKEYIKKYLRKKERSWKIHLSVNHRKNIDKLRVVWFGIKY